MSKLSIFTPSHTSKYLPQLWDSLKDQDFDEWIIVHNNGGEPFDCTDDRVKQHLLYKAPEWVGPLKAYCCEKATGDILMEVDNDDVLLPTAVHECKAAFEDPKIGFAYSNALHADADLNNKTERYSEQFGWRYRQVNFQGHLLDEPISFDPSPASISRIWYAPNHFRAFRRDVYEKIGGYAKDMRVLDDQDLMARMYLETEFKHIDSAQYVYRIHGENSWLKNCDEIQQNVYRLHDKYAEGLAMVWAKRNDLRCIELGGRIAAHPGFETVDLFDADICTDLNSRWPFEDSSVGLLRAADIFEHLRDPVFTMQEVSRVLAPGGWLMGQVPSTDGRGAFQDPEHKSFWNQNSFLYYSHANWSQYLTTKNKPRFQAVRCYTTAKDQREVCWVNFHLLNLKGGYRPPGIIEI